MKNIDFLPADFQNVRSQRTNRYWYVVVFSLFGISLAGATGYQYHVRSGVKSELAQAEPQYVVALAAKKYLRELRQQAIETNAHAELVAYLGHRWPTTRMLATVFEPLPDSVTLNELVVGFETVSKDDSKSPRPRRRLKSRNADEAEEPKGLPATIDLSKLRAECDESRMVITVSGTTHRSDMLHRYVSDLGQSDLIAKAEVSSIETVSNRSDVGSANRESKFVARIVLHAGHGQRDSNRNNPQAKGTHSLAQHRQKP